MGTVLQLNRESGTDETRVGNSPEVDHSTVHSEASAWEASMITQLKADHTQVETVQIAKVSVRSVKRGAAETEVLQVDDGAERSRRRIGRPSAAEPFRTLAERLITEEPEILSVEILRRARLDGYQGGKSVLYQLVAGLHPHRTRVLMRFEGLPGEFSQHERRGRRGKAMGGRASGLRQTTPSQGN